MIESGDILRFAWWRATSSYARDMVILLVGCGEASENFRCLILFDSFELTAHSFSGIVVWPRDYLDDPTHWEKLV